MFEDAVLLGGRGAFPFLLLESGEKRLELLLKSDGDPFVTRDSVLRGHEALRRLNGVDDEGVHGSSTRGIFLLRSS